MHSNCVRTPIATLLLALMLAQVGFAQSEPVANTSGLGQAQFAQIPLRRDAGAGSSIADSAGWVVLLLAAVAGAGFVAIRQRSKMPGAQKGRSWLRPAAGHSAPKSIGRTSLTQQASLHVVAWRGEELLLGCTSQSIALLARRQVEPLPGNDEPAQMAKGQM
jgi:flagellar biogenesis protein FliO